MTFDAEMLMAYVAGELPAMETKRVEAAMAEDPDLAGRVARFRNVRRALRLVYDSVTREPIPDHLMSLLNDVDDDPTDKTPKRRKP